MEIQTKDLSEVDIKKIQKEMAKRGYKLSEEAIREKIEEYEAAYELKLQTRSKTIAFIFSILSLVFLAVQEQMFKNGTLISNGTNRICYTLIGFVIIGVAWLCYLFDIKKKKKLYWITVIAGIVVEAALIACLFLL